jgi:dolichyl-phosphate-mannose--protein O-mannosyl transferase
VPFVSKLAGIEGGRRAALICVLLGLVALAFRLPGLGHPERPVYDEEFFVPRDAPAGARASILPDLTHPPLAMLAIQAGVAVFGDNAIGWRFPSALAGALLAAVFYLTAREALGRERAALIAAGLFVCDNLFLLMSRLAMTNVCGLLFQVAAVGLCLRASRDERLLRPWMMGLGAAIGLALATRWTSIPLAAFLALVFVFRRGVRLRRPSELWLAVLAFALLPVVVYVASYVPWLAEGHSLRDLAWLQQAMWNHHAAASYPHPYSSPWHSWPWLVRPSLFHYEAPDAQRPFVTVLLAIGNPLLWWASVPAVLAVLVRGIVRRDARANLCALGFAVTWGVWARSPLGLVFAHYFLEALVWACLALGLLLDTALETRARVLVRVYLPLVLLTFLFFYPVSTAHPLPSDWFFTPLFGWLYPWRWLPGWY